MSLLHATTTVLDYTASLRLCTHAILTVAQEKTLAKGHCARMRFQAAPWCTHQQMLTPV